MPLFVIDGLLDVKPKLEGNERVVIIGASGGIGSMLIQILRKLFKDDLHITGVCSGRNEKFVMALGANRVVDYTKGQIKDTLKDGGKYDVVFDIIGGQSSHETGKAILDSKGIFITPTGPLEWVGDKKLTALEQASLIFKMIWDSVIMNCIPGSHPSYHLVVPHELNEATFRLAFENGLHPHIEKRVAFNDHSGLEEVIELVRSHRAKGKIVVEIGNI